MRQTFRVGITRDFVRPDGTFCFDNMGLNLLDNASGVEYEFLPEDALTLRADHVQDYDGLLLLGRRVTADTLHGGDRLAILARFGVGYDTVDVEACTRNGVLLTITPDGVRRPVASSIMAFVLALSHKLLIKDHLTRSGRWVDRIDAMGMGLTGRALGLVGLGNIGREVFALAQPFGMRHLAYDPYVRQAEVAGTGVELMNLETLLQTADFVCICCALTPETHHLINAERFALMKETAYLINTARGPIVDQDALTHALRKMRIRGAGLDVFEEEPIDKNHPILTLDNVIVTPHSICWTDECFQGMGRDACQSILDVATGQIPRSVVNREVLDHPSLQEKLRCYTARTTEAK
jgi:D-3-phosphoglycerate dehydrogenase